MNLTPIVKMALILALKRAGKLPDAELEPEQRQGAEAFLAWLKNRSETYTAETLGQQWSRWRASLLEPVAAAQPSPAFRKFTPAVLRGVRYAIAQLEFDAKHGPVKLEDEPVTLSGIEQADMTAAANWLRSQLTKHE